MTTVFRRELLANPVSTNCHSRGIPERGIIHGSGETSIPVERQQFLICAGDFNESRRFRALNLVALLVKPIGMMLGGEPAIRGNDGLSRWISFNP